MDPRLEDLLRNLKGILSVRKLSGNRGSLGRSGFEQRHMEHRMNCGRWWKSKLIGYRTNLVDDLEGPKILEA